MPREYKYFPHVPQDFKENIEWRLKVRTRAASEKRFRTQLLQMCKEDVLFFFSGFVWLHEPRPRMGANGVPLPQIIPFLPWTHQTPIIKQIDEFLGFEDIAAEKSRGEGASWIAMMFCLHRWLFFDMTTVGIISRNELAVDNPEDMDSLMTKLDWELERLPPWMAGEKDADYKRNQSKHTLTNLRNKSVITGYSATGDVMSGGRKTFIIFDELSKFPRGPDQEAMDSTQHVTESRFIIATPKGQDGAYYELMQSDGQFVRLTLDWKDNPSRNRGLFRIHKKLPLAEIEELISDGHHIKAVASILTPVDIDRFGPVPVDWGVEFIQEHFAKLSDRGYAVDDEHKMWSPWYVKQCLRPGANPQSIAQELDRDYGGSVARFFSAVMIDRLLIETAHKPRWIGDLQFVTDTFDARFVQNPNGKMRLWCDLIGGRFPPRNEDYVVGVDTAMGQGGTKSSNSVISVASRTSGKKVAEFASTTTPPEQLADYAIAIAMWFIGPHGPALIIHEDMGPGIQLRNRILETSFRNLYYRSASDVFTKKKSKKVGWIANKNSKRELLGQYAYALAEGLFLNPCDVALKECKDYQVLPNGCIEHFASVSTEDPSSKGVNHGDRVIADALVNWVLYELREGRRDFMKPLEVRPDRVPPTSILGLRMSLQEQEQEDNLW